MKLRQWSLAALMLAAAGCGKTDDATDVDTNSVRVGDPVDLDGDGNPDGFAVDSNGDGIADLVDIDGDGVGDVALPEDGGGSGGGTNGASGNGSNGTANGGSTGMGTGGNTDGNCQEFTVRNEQVAPDILIVLDRSGSMNPDSNDTGTDRWTGSKNAIIASTAQYDDTIRFGLMAFPDDGSCGSDEVAVEIKSMAAADIEGALSSMDANGSTPTPGAIKRAHEVIGSSVAGPDEVAKPKVVLLVTDGAPTCDASGGIGGGGFGNLPPECQGAGLFSQACQDALAMQAGNPALVQSVVDEIALMAGEGTRTFVIGFQTAGTSFAGNLDEMAAAGGTSMDKHTSVSSEAELNTVLDTLIGKAVSCTFVLDEAPPDPSYVLVTVDGQQINYNQPDGWTLSADGKKVQIQGAPCETLQSGDGQHTLNVEVKCEVVPII